MCYLIEITTLIEVVKRWEKDIATYQDELEAAIIDGDWEEIDGLDAKLTELESCTTDLKEIITEVQDA